MRTQPRVRRREPTLSSNLMLFQAENARRLKNIRRDLRRLEWRSRFQRVRHLLGL
jgi:hypothetical protein